MRKEKELTTSRLVVTLPAAARARLEQEAERADIDLSSLVRLKLSKEVCAQIPQGEAA